MAVVWTAYGAIDRWNAAGTAGTEGTEGTAAAKTTSEAFENEKNPEAVLKALQLQNPTDVDAVQAHKTLLQYTQQDYKKGIAIIINIANQFFGPGLTVRKDLDPSTLVANYTNPLVGV
jgi:hydroxypyruvate isomerase